MPLATWLRNRPPTRPVGLAAITFNETIYVLRRTMVSDAGGGGTATWGTVGTATGRIDSFTGGGPGGTRGGAISEQSNALVTMMGTYAVDVRDIDRVVLHGRGTYDVLGISERSDYDWDRFEVVKL